MPSFTGDYAAATSDIEGGHLYIKCRLAKQGCNSAIQ
jgi:hypothetical protein